MTSSSYQKIERKNCLLSVNNLHTILRLTGNAHVANARTSIKIKKT